MPTKAEEERQTAKRANQIALLGVTVAVLSAFIAAGSQLYTYRHNRSQDRSTDKRIGAIETSLRILTDSVAPQLYRSIDDSLRAISANDPQKAAAHLSSTQDGLKQLSKLQAPLSNSSLVQVGTQLSAVSNLYPDLPEVWSTSALLVSFQTASLQRASAVNCLVEGGLLPFPTQPPEPLAGVTIGFENCTLKLDDPQTLSSFVFEQTLKRRALLEKTLGRPLKLALDLQNVTLIYHGGSIPPVDDIFLRGCTFDFQIQSQIPPQRGRQMLRGLITADLSQSAVTTIPIEASST